MTRLILSIIVLTVAITSCKSRKEKPTTENLGSEMVIEVGEDSAAFSEKILREIEVNQSYEWPKQIDPFNILSTEINGDVLKISVEYGGGCKEHEFKMNWTGAWMKSKPPKVNLWLEHQSNEDNCRALIRENLSFDLKSIQSSSSKSVLIIVNGDDDKNILYTYPE